MKTQIPDFGAMHIDATTGRTDACRALSKKAAELGAQLGEMGQSSESAKTRLDAEINVMAAEMFSATGSELLDERETRLAESIAGLQEKLRKEANVEAVLQNGSKSTNRPRARLALAAVSAAVVMTCIAIEYGLTVVPTVLSVVSALVCIAALAPDFGRFASRSWNSYQRWHTARRLRAALADLESQLSEVRKERSDRKETCRQRDEWIEHARELGYAELRFNCDRGAHARRSVA